MASSNYTFRIGLDGADEVRRALLALGSAGEEVWKKLIEGMEKASHASSKTSEALRQTGDGFAKGADSAGLFENAAKRIGEAAASGVGRLSAYALGFVAFDRVAGFATETLRSGVKALAESEQAHRRLAGVLSATGNTAGVTAGRIEDLASGMAKTTLATEEGVKRAAAQLATFRSVSGETFTAAIGLGQDLAAVFGGDVVDQTLRVGKALEDPIEGVSALERQIGRLTPAQKEMIRQFTEAGDKARAQGVVLEALRQKVGGAGTAEAAGLIGATDQLSKSWSDFGKSLAWALGLADSRSGTLKTLAGLARAATIEIDPGRRRENRIAEIDKTLGSDWEMGLAYGFTPSRRDYGRKQLEAERERLAAEAEAADYDRAMREWDATLSADNAAKSQAAEAARERNRRIGVLVGEDEKRIAFAEEGNKKHFQVRVAGEEAAKRFKDQTPDATPDDLARVRSSAEAARRAEFAAAEARAIGEVEKSLKTQAELEGIVGVERERRLAVLDLEKSLDRDLTDNERARVEAAVEGNIAAKTRAESRKRDLDFLKLEVEEAAKLEEIKAQDMLRRQAQRQALDEIVKGLEDETKSVRLTNDQREIAAGLITAEKKLQRELSDQEKTRLTGAIEGLQRQRNAATDLWRGMGDAAKGYFDAVSDYGRLAGDFLANSVFRPLERTISNFFLKSKVDFEQLTQAIRQGLADIGAKIVMAGLGGIAAGLAGSLGGAGGTAIANTIAGKSGGVADTVAAWFRADGGPVWGPGGPKDDRILAFLSNGEHVIAAEHAGRNRAALHALNEGREGEAALLLLRRAANDNAHAQGGAYAGGGEVGRDGIPRFRFGGGAFKAINSVIGKAEAVPFRITGSALDAADLGNTGIADINRMSEAWARQGISADKVAIAALVASTALSGGTTAPLAYAMAAALVASKTGIAQEGLRATGLGDTGLMDIANGLSHAYTGKNAWRNAAIAVAMAYLSAGAGAGLDTSSTMADEARIAAELRSGVITFEDATMRLSEMGAASQQTGYIEKIRNVAEALGSGAIAQDQVLANFSASFGSQAAFNAASVGYLKNVVSDAMLAGLGFGGTGEGDGLFGGLLARYGMAGANAGDLRGMGALLIGGLFDTEGAGFGKALGRNYDTAHGEAAAVLARTHLPGLRKGGIAEGGSFIAHEGELVTALRPARVFNAAETRNLGAYSGDRNAELVAAMKELSGVLRQLLRLTARAGEDQTGLLGAAATSLASIERNLARARAR